MPGYVTTDLHMTPCVLVLVPHADRVVIAGASFMFSNGGSVCSTYPTSYGYSALFYGLTTGTQAQGYSDGNCQDFEWQLFGPGTECWNGGGSTRAGSVNWFHSANGKRSVNDSACVAPDAFNYIDADGKSQSIAVGSADVAEAIADAFLKKDFDTLSSYPQCMSRCSLA